MSAHSIPCRVFRKSGSLYVLMSKEVRQAVNWRAGEFVAARVCGEKVILERIPLDQLAKIRTGETVKRPEDVLGG
jgi:bifunctional DNA-binding transcriptional regulator/antitoxin component of YhaV-PrlF toxin-antitoxin module